ncbi:hypothetical protein [Microbacterium hominis]|uniref:Uncharacterized protein n=1 Tax=Microbacterium hominis TaxID=162426 RepID=A0A7D4TFR5_9MICO|nr:hypothetical protein [Microbacterium hominis]QKJ18781.1 hypothetical protein HQM25_04890 [Microbacterium hominis]
MDSAIDAIVEIFTWVGLGTGAFLAVIALILSLFDGTWHPARAVIEEDGHGRFVRWFDEEGGVNEARLSHEQDHALAGATMADIFYRRGSRGRMRLTPGSPVVRGFLRIAIGLLALGLVALVLSGVLLFARG